MYSMHSYPLGEKGAVFMDNRAVSYFVSDGGTKIIVGFKDGGSVKFYGEEAKVLHDHMIERFPFAPPPPAKLPDDHFTRDKRAKKKRLRTTADDFTKAIEEVSKEHS